MNILVIGGTRFFGIHMVNELLTAGYDVTIATRGKASDSFGDKVKRIFLERTKEESVREALSGTHYDVVIDKIAYCSNDIKYVMDVIDCDKYIYMSSTSVYNPKHINTVEADFDGIENELIWCDRKAFPYEQIKRQAECALWQQYPEKNWIAVRYPFAIGKDDYTKRLLFYVEHTMKSIPMNIDNVDYQMSYIRSDEAGKFLTFLVDKDVKGAINGASDGTISIKEIIEYVEEKTGARAIIDNSGEDAPYNGEPEYSICTDKAKELGYAYLNVEKLTEPEVLNPNMYRISREGREFFDVKAIYVFRSRYESYWHICFGNGSERDYHRSELNIVESCLTQSQSSNVFEYIKQIAGLSNIRNEETGEKLLSKRFDKISFVGSDVALRELTDNDMSRIGTLMEENLYNEVLKYMKENNLKLEQEIVSYYLVKDINYTIPPLY